MATDVKVRDLDQVSIIFGAILIDAGALNPDSGISIEYDSPRFSDVVGAGGEVARGKTNDLRASITISVLQTSAVNDLLSAQMDLDLLSPNGIGLVPLMIKDRSGTSLYIAEKAWIMSTPSVTFSTEPGYNEWVLRAGSLKPFIGGN